MVQKLTRVRAELVAIIGAAPQGSSASEEDIALLERIPRLRLRRVQVVGHVVQEEDAPLVVTEVLAAQARRAVALR